jgi:hypothetical protein
MLGSTKLRRRILGHTKASRDVCMRLLLEEWPWIGEYPQGRDLLPHWQTGNQVDLCMQLHNSVPW